MEIFFAEECKGSHGRPASTGLHAALQSSLPFLWASPFVSGSSGASDTVPGLSGQAEVGALGCHAGEASTL